MESKKEYMNISEVSNYYKVSTKTVRNWIKRGMPSTKLGNVLRFDYQKIDEWVNSVNKK